MFLGSTDTVVYCTMGASDVLTATLHIVLGKKIISFSIPACINIQAKSLIALFERQQSFIN